MSTTSADIEIAKRPKEYLEGFADFSHYIASDDSLSVYRRFGSLGSRNILYMQAELQFLEQQLEELDDADRELVQGNAGDEKKSVDDAARAWESFTYQDENGNERQRKKMKLILRIREVMRNYEETTLRRSQILALGSPTTGTLTAFTNWFRTRMPFRGSSYHLLDEEHDLMSLSQSIDSDRLSAFIQHYFGYYLKSQNLEMPQSWAPMYYFPAKRVAWIVAILSILISALLLVGAILALYLIQSMRWRLAVIGIFTTVFAVSVGVLTNARRGEIFGTTAAYAAVLVVFLSAPT